MKKQKSNNDRHQSSPAKEKKVYGRAVFAIPKEAIESGSLDKRFANAITSSFNENVEKLDIKLRIPYKMYFDGCSVDDIAYALLLSPRTVVKRILAAAEQLKAMSGSDSLGVEVVPIVVHIL